MGRRKFRLGRIPKNYEKDPKRKVKKEGRPRKITTSRVLNSSRSNQPSTGSQSSCSCPSSSSCPLNKACLETLTSDLVLPSKQWIIQTQNPDCVGICKISLQDTMVVTHSLVVTQDLSWTLTVHGKKVDPQTCSALSCTPSTLSTATLQTLLSILDTAAVCPGHPDQQFLSMLEAKKGKLSSRDGCTVVAYVDSYCPVTLNGETYPKTVRYSSCEMVVGGAKCPSCVTYRNSLRKSYHRWLKQKSLSPRRRQSTSSKTALRFLNTPEKTERYTQLRAQLYAKTKEVERMRSKVATLTEKHGVQLGELSSDFKDVMEEMTSTVHESHPILKDRSKEYFGMNK